MRILVVDDDRAIVKLIARVLRDEAYAVDTASTGEEARTLALVNEYDGIILDLQLGDRHGAEAPGAPHAPDGRDRHKKRAARQGLGHALRSQLQCYRCPRRPTAEKAAEGRGLSKHHDSSRNRIRPQRSNSFSEYDLAPLSIMTGSSWSHNKGVTEMGTYCAS